MSKFYSVFTGHPEIYPLVLTAKTQEIFNCRIDEDMTDEQTYKLIKKEDILADLQNRAAVSDFHPVKKIVLVNIILLFALSPNSRISQNTTRGRKVLCSMLSSLYLQPLGVWYEGRT